MEDQQQENKPTELEECKKTSEEYLNGWKRAKADLINYKREESQRFADMAKYSRQNFIFQILPILDNLFLTAKEMPKELMENLHVKGLLQIKVQLEYFLKSNGVEAIESLGQKFDPNFHEVVQMVDAPDQESGTIIEETQKGYKIDGNLLRPAKVKVAK